MLDLYVHYTIIHNDHHITHTHTTNRRTEKTFQPNGLCFNSLLLAFCVVRSILSSFHIRSIHGVEWNHIIMERHCSINFDIVAIRYLNGFIVFDGLLLFIFIKTEDD